MASTSLHIRPAPSLGEFKPPPPPARSCLQTWVFLNFPRCPTLAAASPLPPEEWAPVVPGTGGPCGGGSPCAPPHPRRRPSGTPAADLRSTLVPYFLQQRDALRRLVRRQEAESRRLAEAVAAGRRQVRELQRRGRAREQAWQVSAGASREGGSPQPRAPVARKRARQCRLEPLARQTCAPATAVSSEGDRILGREWPPSPGAKRVSGCPG